MKQSKFRPTPAEILSAVAVEHDQVPKPKQLEQGPMSEEEKVEVQGFINKLADKLSIPKALDFKTRSEELRRQQAEVIRKYGKK
jgi:hypothetical protein